MKSYYALKDCQHVSPINIRNPLFVSACFHHHEQKRLELSLHYLQNILKLRPQLNYSKPNFWIFHEVFLLNPIIQRIIFFKIILLSFYISFCYYFPIISVVTAFQIPRCKHKRDDNDSIARITTRFEKKIQKIIKKKTYILITLSIVA